MEDINWQNSYARRFAGKKHPLKGEHPGAKGKDSFADKFLGKSTIGHQSQHEDFRNMPNQAKSAPPSNGNMYDHERHYPYQHPHTAWAGQQVAYQSYEPLYPGYPGGDNANLKPQYPSDDHHYQSKWRFLNLESRKQTGDLYKKILSANSKNKAKSFCFTSSLPKEGVTTVLANLLDYVKQQGTSKRVIAIDANANHPDLSNVFGLPANCQGLRDVMSRRIDLQSALIPIEPDIRVLCCGGRQEHGNRNFEPEEFSNILKDCSQFADFIFIDCPPILSSPDALSIAPAADLSFLIIQAIKVRRQVAEKSLVALQNNECEMGGVILNRVEQVIPSWLYRFI